LKASNRGLVNPDYSDFRARVGFAYSLNNKSVVRGGIGLYYAPLLSSDIVSGLEGYDTIGIRRMRLQHRMADNPSPSCPLIRGPGADPKWPVHWQ